jgi:hypothetical protein
MITLCQKEKYEEAINDDPSICIINEQTKQSAFTHDAAKQRQYPCVKPKTY